MGYETQQQWEDRVASVDSTPTILDQAYPDISSNREVLAKAALDIRKAGTLVTVAEVVTDKQKIQDTVAHFVADMESQIDTGAIDLPGFNETEKTGAVIAVLMHEAQELAQSTNQGNEANSALIKQRDEALRYVTPDQITLVTMVEEQAAKIAALEAQLEAAHAEIAADRLKIADRDRIIFKKSSEGIRDRVTRMKTFGSVAISQLRAS